MKLLVEPTDMRGNYTSQDWWEGDVIDQDTGKKVGLVEARRSPARRHISLFGGKYQVDFTSQEQCEAFAKGVEAVFNHVAPVDDDEKESGERRGLAPERPLP